jgi:hypothetical protein
MEQSMNHSDRLFHGKIDDFEDVCRALIHQYRQESDWINANQNMLPAFAMQRLWKIEKYIRAIEQCQQEYHEALFKMEEAFIALWGASHEEIPQKLAQALRDGDYSRVAL